MLVASAWSCQWRLAVLSGLLVTGFVAVGTPAHAALGGPAAGIAQDASRMKAKVATHAMPGYTRADITRPNGGTIREFANGAGQVFAVTWQGPGKPDLRRLLGSHFSALTLPNGAPGEQARSWRRPQLVNRSDLKIVSTGHMGWFRGVAYIPSLVPPGFDLGTLDPGA